MARQPLSVNDALAALDAVAGQDITVHGRFSFEFKNVSLQHLPAGERKDEYGSSLWLSVGSGSLAFEVQACRKLHGKDVVVEGTLLKPDPSLGGAGHKILWPAELVARTLTRA